ncbi:KilA-N domain-containing protein [Candidatus Halobeggiatoa sp. HSG11]|nr:KilA-N domain-containing protein [Candidatus Halobeggiatoa sp. HSG11]
MTTQNLISRDFHGATIRQRSDGYLNATDMCQATNKRLNDYKRLKSTKEYIKALSSDTGIPASNIIKGVKGIQKGKTAQDQGTWIHPNASIHLAIWCSPDFAVLVTKWVFELLTEGSVSLNPEQSKQKIVQLVQAKSKELDNQRIIGNAKRIALNDFIKEHSGYDVLELLGIESQVAEVQQALLNPTKIAERVSLKNAIAVNKELIALGLQTKHYDNKKHVYYELTEKGLKYGQYQDTKIRKASKTIRGIKWYDSVLKFFQLVLTPTIKPLPQPNFQLF